ncbi:MAG: hypothetical protein Q8922_11265 [Bacteroidota bacterium]|nr:hypothetical protein [Bacteroidota bacterium]MDP4233958.1 hypothetical protein [Bacteroidota bacterium]MDP4242791.1 hypothetical protein [Bacteroidota bacterium]MDP4288505.1 hypothetical protein [Bacteroidota bacterium]
MQQNRLKLLYFRTVINKTFLTGFWPYLVLVGAISMCEIAISSPLFATLGFEYSTLTALALSFVCGMQASLNAQSWRRNLVRTLWLWSIPLVISFASLLWFRNCALWDGVVFYLEIALPSALLGCGFGAAFSMLFRKRRTSFLIFFGFWIVTLILSLLPGYTNPQLFTYGWQYGYFPGFVWDEALELTNAYLLFRLENLLWFMLILSLPLAIRSRRSLLLRNGIPLALFVTAFGLFTQNDAFRITSSHLSVQQRLPNILQVGSNCQIHYDSASMTVDESREIIDELRWYLFDVRRRFELHDTISPTNIYIYPSAEALFSSIGTRAASIAKPWLGEVHIMKSNLHSLKHELTHVLMREKADWPFYASWSTGLTEGAAMSVEPEFDGLYTLDEHAARILQLHYAPGVKSVMAFTGFAANASTKSYVLAGSFSRYLLRTYGAKHFDRVYLWLNFEKEYGKSLDSLEAEWKRSLAPLMTSLNPEDSAHFQYYYERASIIFNPCLRRIGKLSRRARGAFVQSHYADAERLYHSAKVEGGGMESLIGECYSILMQGDASRALTLLDTTRFSAINKQRAVLYLEKGDLSAMLNNGQSESNYDSAQRVKLNTTQFLSGYLRAVLDTSDIAPIFHRYLYSLYHSRSMADSSRMPMLDSMASTHHQTEYVDRVTFAIRVLQSLILQESGKLSRAAQLNPFQGDELQRRASENSFFPDKNILSKSDSLAISQVYLHLAELPNADRLTLSNLLQAENYCPSQYSRAMHEISDEIDGRWHFTYGIPPPRGHETYP